MRRMMKRNLIITSILALMIPLAAVAQNGAGEIHAEFLYEVSAPGNEEGLLRPSQVLYDLLGEEYYIADTGNDRVIILDHNGLFEYEFSAVDRMRAPQDVAVDSDGKFYVLGSSNSGKTICVFDYNGDFLHRFEFNGGPDRESIDIGNIVIDLNDRMFILDFKGKRILAYGVNGDFISEFPILENLKEKIRQEQVFGNLYTNGDLLYIPAPAIGSIYCYEKTGKFVRMIGHKGGAYGELSFPVAVSLDSHGNIFVLDKHRHTIVYYDSNIKVLGEIGGRGVSPGWFYHPQSMIVDSQDRVFVAQVFQHKVQVFQINHSTEPAIAQEIQKIH